MTAPFEMLSDEDLARQTKAGSLEAFEQLVYRYEGRVYGFVSNSGQPPTDAREVTQDTFVRAFQAIAQFDPRQAFAPWLFTIARRKCLDRYRSAPRLADTSPAEEPEDLDDPFELLSREEEGRNLWHLARQRLPETHFQALWLRYVEDLSVAEIAPVLGKTQTHVKVLLFRARHALGRELGKTALSSRTQSPVRPDPPLAVLPHPLRKDKHANLAS